MILKNATTRALLRALLASIVAWPVFGLWYKFLWGKPPDGRHLNTQWQLFRDFVWTHLYAFPYMEGLLMGHYVFFFGLFRLAKVTNLANPRRKEILTVTSLLVAGFILKLCSFLLFFRISSENYVGLLDCVVAIAVVWVTKSRSKVEIDESTQPRPSISEKVLDGNHDH